MKNSVIASTVLFLLVILVFAAPVLGVVTVESSIDQDVYVTIDFKDIDPLTYENIKVNKLRFNETTIPRTIMNNLAGKDLERVGWGYARIDYNDTESSVHVAFHLSGSDIISFTVNKTSMTRTYQVSTEWRKFKVDLAEGYSVDFAQHFSTPVSQWHKTNHTDTLGVHPAYYDEHTGQDSLRLFFYFILPTTAKKIQVVEDTISYEVPPYAEDVFLNSPFLILGSVMAITIMIVVYRKTRA